MKSFSTVLLSALMLAAAAAPAGAAPADAAASDSDFYIGLDGRIDQLYWKDSVDTHYPQSIMGLGLRLGYHFSPYLATEIGLSESSDENKEIDIKADRWRYHMTMREAQFDVFAYLPLGETGWFKPFLTAGLAYAEGNARLRQEIDSTTTIGTTAVTYTTLFNKGEIDWRAGFGLEANLSDSLTGRIYVRYQSYSFGAMDGGTTFGFTLNTPI